MKKIVSIILVILLTLSLGGCGRGNVRQVKRAIGDSSIFTRQDIAEAMDIATEYFQREFEGCTLHTMVYNEFQSIEAAKGWAQQYDAYEAIVLLSSFTVGIDGSDGSLNPGDTYTDWQWILTRNLGEKWTLQTWGYG